eukprot:11840088-Alexandrium_andersonii.AAC.1
MAMVGVWADRSRVSVNAITVGDYEAKSKHKAKDDLFKDTGKDGSEITIRFKSDRKKLCVIQIDGQQRLQ